MTTANPASAVVCFKSGAADRLSCTLLPTVTRTAVRHYPNSARLRETIREKFLTVSSLSDWVTNGFRHLRGTRRAESKQGDEKELCDEGSSTKNTRQRSAAAKRNTTASTTTTADFYKTITYKVCHNRVGGKRKLLSTYHDGCKTVTPRTEITWQCQK